MKHLLLIVILTFTAACSLNGEAVDENLSESQLYQRTQDDLNNKGCNSAVVKLKALESRYPFDRYAGQAQLELIYTSHKSMESKAARAAAEYLIRLYPQHLNVDYAYCLKGLFSLDQDHGLLAHFLSLDMTKRDPGAIRDSFNGFAQLTSRFLNSRCAPGARARMAYLRNLLATYEMHVGHYYPERQAYIATANRGRCVVGNFQETPAVSDGLAIVVGAYRHLDLDDLASISLETLKLSYPDNASLKDDEFVTHESETDIRLWLARAALGLIENGEPPPHMGAQAARDVTKQYEDAERETPAELESENRDHSADDGKPKSDDDEDPGRSWWSCMTFSLFD